MPAPALSAPSAEPLPSGIPRLLEVTLALSGLVIALPVLAVAALLIRATSRGPAFFRQERVGQRGAAFTLFKLRTMRWAPTGPQLTARDDDRITSIGKVLRKTKLDELPQLWNVVRGDMSLVGPRPEVPRYVSPSEPIWQRVLQARPGITDPVTLELRDEEALLARIEGDRERFYREQLQPAKLRRYIAYLESRSAWKDVQVLYRTALAVLLPGPGPETPDDLMPRETTKEGPPSKSV